MSLTTTILDHKYPIVYWPESVSDPPVGWHWGTHVSLGARGTGYYLINDADDDVAVIALRRPDLDADNVPSASDLDAIDVDGDC